MKAGHMSIWHQDPYCVSSSPGPVVTVLLKIYACACLLAAHIQCTHTEAHIPKYHPPYEYLWSRCWLHTLPGWIGGKKHLGGRERWKIMNSMVKSLEGVKALLNMRRVGGGLDSWLSFFYERCRLLTLKTKCWLLDISNYSEMYNTV